MMSDLNTAAPITSEDIAPMQELRRAAENAQSILAAAVSTPAISGGTSIHVAAAAAALEAAARYLREAVRGCSAERVRLSGCT